MKRIITNILEAMGYQLTKIKTDEPTNGTMETAIQLLAQNHHINTIIDVGASDGIWSRLALNYFPQSQYFLIEANPAHEQSLEKFVLENRTAQFILAAAGDRQGGEVNFSFDPEDLYGGQASYASQANSISIPEIMIDREIESRELKGPYLLKLDTHGFEIPILKGALQTLTNTDAIIIECYNFKISPECLLFYEMCQYLDQLGFRCIDFADPLWRPFDQAFWQMDLIFIKKERPEFSHLSYQ